MPAATPIARYWQDLEFIDGERVLDLQTALGRFVDATGRPGPAGWQLGKYPAGAADLPVTGVSWFEAAAYAKFRGKSLPTVHHWRRAVGESIAAPMTRFGNFTGRVQAGRAFAGLGPFGTYDMIGNAAEWVSNAKGADHLVSGGAATDAPYVGYWHRLRRRAIAVGSHNADGRALRDLSRTTRCAAARRPPYRRTAAAAGADARRRTRRRSARR